MTTKHRGYSVKAIQYPSGDWRAIAKRDDGMTLLSTSDDSDYDFETEEEAIEYCKELIDQFLDN